MKKKIVLIAPYFGKLPQNFEFWYRTALSNCFIDFVLIGDCFNEAHAAENMFVEIMLFEEVRKLLKEELGVKSLSTPYKLCDFKPSYGELFHKHTIGYEYWGYVDFDLVLGDLKGIERLGLFAGDFHKIFDLGHLSFYKNDMKINSLYRSAQVDSNHWEYVKNSKIIWVYDESYDKPILGINGIFKESGCSLFSDRDTIFDVNPNFNGFIRAGDVFLNPCFFYFDGKRLYSVRYNGEGFLEKHEYSYAHFQKRKYKIVECSKRRFIVVPDHWDAGSFLGAVRCLKRNKFIDWGVDGAYRRWKYLRFVKKYSRLFFEIFIVKGAMKFIWSKV